MDTQLVGYALQFHGVDLLNSLTTEQQEQPSAAIMSYLDRKQHRDPEIKDEEFQKRVCAFIGRKSDMLFKPLSEEEKNIRKAEHVIDDAYAIMPAMETFMDVPSHLRREHFFKSLKPDDCVTGVVLSVLDNGLRIQLLCVDKGLPRDIDDLDIQVFCPVKELPKLYPNAGALEAFQEKDIVRGIVLVVSVEAERIIISLHEKAIPNKETYPRIGLITEEEFPVYYRRKKQIQGMCYGEMLHSILGFNNMGNVKALVNQLGIPDSASYMRYHSRLQIPEKEFAEGLRKWQSQKLAHQSVAQGVEMFKSGKYLEALQYFNRALQIDKQNVEALVARGALHANKENFNHAIQDFEEALSINPKHSNARNYLTETLLTFGKICEDKQQLEEAAVHYSHVLKIDPHHTEANEMLTGLAVQKTAGKGRMEMKRTLSGDADVRDKKGGTINNSIFSKTAHKLRQLINEDKKGEPRDKNNKRRSKHRSPSLSEKPRRKRKRSSSSSSSSSSSDSSSSSSGGSGSSSSNSSSSSSGSSNSSSCSSSSSGHRTKGKKRLRKSQTESDSSQDSAKKNRRHSSAYSIRAKKRIKIEKGGRKQLLNEKEEMKEAMDPGLRDKKAEQDKFVPKAETSSTGGLLAASSFEHACSSAATPGLDDRHSSIRAAEDRLPGQSYQDPLYGRNVEGPRENLSTLRRDDFLMAEREKFYKDNKDRYKISWPHSRDRSSSSSSAASSRSSQSSKSSHRGKRSNGRRRSKSQTKRSPVMTGIKDLDKYLGGAKKLLNRMDSKEKPSTWEYFSDLFRKKSRLEGSSDRKSHSWDRRSGSQELSMEKGSSAQADRVAKSESQVGKGKNRQEDSRFGNKNRRDSTEKEDHGKFKRDCPENDSLKSRSPYSINKETAASTCTLNDDGRQVQNEWSEQLISMHNDHGKKVFLETKSDIFRQERKDSNSRTDDGPVGRGKVDKKDFRGDKRNCLHVSKQSGDGTGKINTDIKKEQDILVIDLQEKNNENHKDDKLIHEDGEKVCLQKQGQEMSEQIFDDSSFYGPKAPRDTSLLKKPKMDDPELHKSLLLSNELAEIDREQKIRKLEAWKVSPDNKASDKQRFKRKIRSSSRTRSRSTERRTQSRSSSRGKKKQSKSTEKDKNYEKDLDRKKRHDSSKKDGQKIDRNYSKERDRKHDQQDDHIGHKRYENNEHDEEKLNKRSHEKHITKSVPSGSKKLEVRLEKKWLDKEEIKKEIERRGKERLKVEENRQKKEIGHLRKSRWDINKKDINDVNKFDELDRVGNNSEAKQSDGVTADVKYGHLGSSGLSLKDSFLKGQKHVSDWRSTGIHGNRLSSTDLTSNMKHSTGVLHSRWDREDATGDSKKSALEDREVGQKAGQGEKKLQSLTDLEKFLIDLKQQKKKQWIAEGKLKEKY